jgi:hypothetical protein
MTLPLSGLPTGLIYNRKTLPLEGVALPAASPDNDNLRAYESIPFLLRNAGTGRHMRMRYREDLNRWINLDSVFNPVYSRADATTLVNNFLSPGSGNGVTATGQTPVVPFLGQDLTILGATLNYANGQNPDATWNISVSITTASSNAVIDTLDFVSGGAGQSDGVGSNRVWTLVTPIILPTIDPIRLRMAVISGTGLNNQLNDPIVKLKMAWTEVAT